MNGLKKLVKKPIAIIITLLIVTGAVSVAVFADDYPNAGSFSTNTVWYVENNGNYTQANYAQRGDRIRADVYLTSDFLVGDIALFLVYNSDMLSLDTSVHGARASKDVITPLIADNSDPGDPVPAEGTFREATSNMIENRLIGSGLFTADDFVGVGSYYLAMDLLPVMQYNNTKAFEFYWTVKGSVELQEEGVFNVLNGSNKTPEANRANLPSEVSYVTNSLMAGHPNTDLAFDDYLTPEYYTCVFTSTSEHLKVTGNINFDAVSMDYGTVTIDDSAVISGNKQGYWNTGLQAADIPEVTPAEGYKLVGWSTEKATASQSVDGKNYYGGDYSSKVTDYSAIIYGSDDNIPVLYAIYGDADVKYTVKLYTPDLDAAGKELSGTYTLAATYADLDGSVNDVISAEDSAVVNPAWIPDGFENNSTASVTLGLNAANNVLEVRLDRTTKRIKWIIGSETVKGGDEAPVTVYYGGNAGTANYPDPTAAEIGDDYFGKGITWSNHETSPVTGDIEVTGTLSNLPVTVYINAQDTINNVTGTWYGEDGVVNHEVTGLKYNDSIPADAASTLQLPEGYESVAFRYNDADGVSQRVNSLSQIPAINKENVEIGSDLVFSIDVEYILHTGYAVFNANGGSFEDDEVTDNVPYNYGDIILERSAPENPKKVNGYTYDFLGWATTANATVPDAVFDSEGPVFGSEDPVFYAVWKYDTVKLVPKNSSSKIMIERSGTAPRTGKVETYNTGLARVPYDILYFTDVITPFSDTYGTYNRYAEDAAEYDTWYVYGIEPGTTAAELDNAIAVTGGGSYQLVGRYVGTGTIIKVYDKNGAFVEQFRIVVYGDLDGNGRINNTDVRTANQEIDELKWSDRESEDYKSYIFRASDLDQNGSFNNTDYRQFVNYIDSARNIDQVSGITVAV